MKRPDSVYTKNIYYIYIYINIFYCVLVYTYVLICVVMWNSRLLWLVGKHAWPQFNTVVFEAEVAAAKVGLTVGEHGSSE